MSAHAFAGQRARAASPPLLSKLPQSLMFFQRFSRKRMWRFSGLMIFVCVTVA